MPELRIKTPCFEVCGKCDTKYIPHDIADDDLLCPACKYSEDEYNEICVGCGFWVKVFRMTELCTACYSLI